MTPNSPSLKFMLPIALVLAAMGVLALVIDHPVPVPDVAAVPLARPPHQNSSAYDAPAENLSAEPSPAAITLALDAEKSAPLGRRNADAPVVELAASAQSAAAPHAVSSGTPARTRHPGASPAGHANASPAAGTVPPLEAFEREPGVQVPVSFVSLDEISLSEPQANQLSEIATDFLRAVDASPNASEAWKAEQVRADGRFRTLFGRDLHMRQMLNAAREARGVPMIPAPQR